MQRHLLAKAVLFVMLAGCVSPVGAEGRPAVAVWNFDGTLADRSGHGNDAFAASAAFTPGHSGQGLRCGQGPAIVPDSPELRTAPGLRIECWVRLDALGTTWQPLVIKDRAYQLRLDPPKEGGRFSFFVHLDGWEPRVRSKEAAKIGEWYHVMAGWDGKEIWIQVGGQRASVRRSGTPTPSD